jgi:hypothetical protein
MVDVGPKCVNKPGRECVWYRPQLPMPRAVLALRGDGALSRFSTTVENSVENSGLSGLATMKSLVLSGSAYGEGLLVAIFPTVFRS